MDYADKVSAFMSDFDEEKNSFYQAQSQKVQEGSLEEKQGGDVDGIGLAVGTIGYKITAKLGLNQVGKEVADKAIYDVKQAASDAYKSVKTSVGDALSPAAASPVPPRPGSGGEPPAQDDFVID